MATHSYVASFGFVLAGVMPRCLLGRCVVVVRLDLTLVLWEGISAAQIETASVLVGIVASGRGLAENTCHVSEKAFQ